MGQVGLTGKGLLRKPFFSLVLCLATVVSTTVFCQVDKVPGGSRYNSTSGGNVLTLPSKVKSLSGEVLWFSEPEKGIIELLNKDSLTYLVNIRLDIPGVEIHTDSVVKVLPMALVHSITVDSHKYVTNKYFKNVKLPLGFYEILILDRYSLFGHLDYTIQAVTYNVQLDVGETSPQPIRQTKFYIISPTFRVLDLDNTKKKRIKTFFSDPLKTEAYFKQEKIKVAKSSDLKKWVAYENSIIN